MRIGHVVPEGARRIASTGVKRSMLRVASNRPLRSGLQILMFHELPSPDALHAQLTAVRNRGAVFVDENAVLRLLTGEERWPTEQLAVWLTMDDGYAMNFTAEHFRVTESLKVRLHVFLIAAVLDDETPVPRKNELNEVGEARPLVRRRGVRSACESGWTFGSHTLTHFRCSSGTAADWSREIDRPCRLISDATGTPVRTFAWPYGLSSDTCDDAVQALESAGIIRAFSGVRGHLEQPPNSPWFVPRDNVDASWSPRQFLGATNGGLQLARLRARSRP